MEEGTLYIVATPIGNLEDVTLRALRILGEVDVIFCEDTRIARRLLQKYDIHATLKSLNARTEESKLHVVIGLLGEGKDVAYVSDAGTPTVSDPGTALVAAARAAGFKVVAVPGPSALTAALSIAGVPASEFLFVGFLPHKKGRRTLLTEIAETKRTVVLYESTHRIMRLLSELENAIAQRRVCIARELTKVHEEVQCGTAAQLRKLLEDSAQKQKGEFVVIIAPHE